MLNWFRKKHKLPSIGQFKETLGQTLWWGTIPTFVMSAGTFYYTTLRFVFPWFTLSKFIATVLIGVVAIYALETRFGVKSLWKFRANQMGMAEAKNKGKVIVVAVGGGFDPLNGRGHITHIQEARKLGDKLVVMLNRNDQLIAKGNKPNGTFYPDIEDRIAIVKELRSVDEVIINIDKDGTCADTLRMIKPQILAKGGDRTPDNMPQNEIEACEKIGCDIVYNVGEPKTTSSSKLVRGER